MNKMRQKFGFFEIDWDNTNTISFTSHVCAVYTTCIHYTFVPHNESNCEGKQFVQSDKTTDKKKRMSKN